MKTILTFIILLSSTYSWAFDHPIQARSLENGTIILTNSQGLSAYTFDVDQNGISNCHDSCLATWSAITTELDHLEAPFGIHVRDNGTKQVTFNNSPLYLFIGDSQQGDINGDNLGNVWHLIELGENL